MNKKVRKKTKKRKKKKGGKKGKDGPKGFFIHTEMAQKLIFYMRYVNINRHEIEAQKKSDFEHPTKKMKENERKWKNEKNETMSKIKKWKKLKKSENEKNEQRKKMWKKTKKWRKWWKKKEKWKCFVSDEKFSTISRVYRCCCNFFSSKSLTISMILFRNVCLSRGKSTTRFAGSPFSEEKWQISLDVKQKHTFYRRKNSLRSVLLSIIFLFCIIQPFNNDNNASVGFLMRFASFFVLFRMEARADFSALERSHLWVLEGSRGARVARSCPSGWLGTPIAN